MNFLHKFGRKILNSANEFINLSANRNHLFKNQMPLKKLIQMNVKYSEIETQENISVDIKPADKPTDPDRIRFYKYRP